MEDSSVDRGSKAKKVNDKNFRINKYFRKELIKPTFLPERFQSYKSNIIIVYIFLKYYIYSRLFIIRWRYAGKSRSQKEIKVTYPSTY